MSLTSFYTENEPIIYRELLRSKERNEDEYEFICLASVRMHSFPWHALNAGGKLVVDQRNFEENRLRENNIYCYCEFQLIKIQ